MSKDCPGVDDRAIAGFADTLQEIDRLCDEVVADLAGSELSEEARRGLSPAALAALDDAFERRGLGRPLGEGHD